MSTNLETQSRRGQELSHYLCDLNMKRKLQAALPLHMSAERMIRIALTAATRNPALLNCTMESIGLALLTASQLGLEPNGRDAHLVPFRNTKARTVECQLIPDYKGLIQLAYRSGQVDNISAKAVYSKDKFEYELGTNEHLKHIPTDADDPGKLVYAWASVRFRRGGSKFVVLNRRDVLRRMAKSQSAAMEGSIWQMFPEAMWAKSAIKELAKWMPQTPELHSFRKAVAEDDKTEFLPGEMPSEGVNEEPEDDAPWEADQQNATNGDQA
jgi:recombination protein RecT